MNLVQKKTAAVLVALTGATGAVGAANAQGIEGFGQDVPGAIISTSSCPGVFQMTVPFCREECGQDQGLLNARRGALSDVLRSADANGDGIVYTVTTATARRDESQPQRFMQGRINFLQREAGRIMSTSSVGTAVDYTSGEPSGTVYAADTRAALTRQCTPVR